MGLTVYRCVSCIKSVTSRQHAICCDMCGSWQHRKCNTGITVQQYRKMCRDELDIDWVCVVCKTKTTGLESDDNTGGLLGETTFPEPPSPTRDLPCTFTTRPADFGGKESTDMFSEISGSDAMGTGNSTNLTSQVPVNSSDESNDNGDINTQDSPMKVTVIKMASGNFNLSSDSDSSDEEGMVVVKSATDDTEKRTQYNALWDSDSNDEDGIPAMETERAQYISSLDTDSSDDDEEEEEQGFHYVRAPVTYEVIAGASARDNDMLACSEGYTYNLKRSRRDRKYWRCTFTGDHLLFPKCYTSVTQHGTVFKENYEHRHPPSFAGDFKLKITAKLKDLARHFPDEMAAKLVDLAVEEVNPPEGTLSYFKRIRNNLKQVVTRTRQKDRKVLHLRKEQ